MKTIHTNSDKNNGIAIRAVAGICRSGMMPVTLHRKMNTNRLSRNGVHAKPSLPIVCMTTLSSMNSTDVSARLRMPFGATFAVLACRRAGTRRCR